MSLKTKTPTVSKAKKKAYKKGLLKVIDRYGIFNDRPFIKKEYRNELVKDLINVYEINQL